MAGRAAETGDLSAGVAGGGQAVVRAQGQPPADDLGLAEPDEGRPQPHLLPAAGRRRPHIEGPLHGPDEGRRRIRVVRRIDDVEADDEVAQAARFGPGRGEGDEDAVAEGDIGRRGARAGQNETLGAGEGDAPVGQGRPADLTQVDLEQGEGQTEPADQPSGEPRLDEVALAVIEGQRPDQSVMAEGPIQGRRRIDPAGEKDDARSHGPVLTR